MAAGVAVVVSDIDGYRDAAGGHGFLFRPGDAVDLRRAVIEAGSATTSERVSARAHAQRWSMTALVDAYGEVAERAKFSFERR
jgi:glycosyltransferase involved in cell wall biosynthesis